MRILVVTVVHTPLDARIHHRQIRALVADGIEVTYLAPWRDTGTPREAVLDGVTARDLPRAVGRRRLTALRAARRAVRALAPAHDLVLLHDPELALAVAGRLRRLPPVVLDVHEDLAASLVDRTWLPPALRGVAVRGARWLERWAESRLHLLLAEDGYTARFARTHPVVPNLPWLPADAPPAGDERVVHVGRLSRGRGAAELVEVARLLTAVGGPHLHLVGEADRDVADLVRRAADERVLTWHGFLPSDEALALVRGAVAGLALLHDLPNYRVSMPTKVVEYLAHRVPAVVTPLPRAAELVERAGGGIVVPFAGAAEAAAEAVLRLAADAPQRHRLGDAGRAHAQRYASWDAAAPAFVAHLRDLAAEGSP